MGATCPMMPHQLRPARSVRHSRLDNRLVLAFPRPSLDLPRLIVLIVCLSNHLRKRLSLHVRDPDDAVSKICDRFSLNVQACGGVFALQGDRCRRKTDSKSSGFPLLQEPGVESRRNMVDHAEPTRNDIHWLRTSVTDGPVHFGGAVVRLCGKAAEMSPRSVVKLAVLLHPLARTLVRLCAALKAIMPCSH